MQPDGQKTSSYFGDMLPHAVIGYTSRGVFY